MGLIQALRQRAREWRTQQDLRRLVLDTLSHPALRCINFQYVPLNRSSSLLVNADAFREVRNQISNAIDVHLTPLGPDDPRSLGGQYDANNNSLRIIDHVVNEPDQRKADPMQIICHECVHALCDLRRVKGWLVWENEAVAFLADTMFAVARTGPRPWYSTARHAALRVANAKRLFWAQSPVILGPHDLAPIGHALGSDLYDNKNAVHDGYDGVRCRLPHDV